MRSRRPSTKSPASRPRSRETSTSDPLTGEPAFRFVGGKGGVGKTTCAAAIAVTATRAGRRTLLVSTDPAPSLADVLQRPVGRVPRPLRVPRGHLDAVAIDATRALDAWLRPRIPLLEEIALRGTWLDRQDVSRILAQTLPGVDELAALLEIARLARSSEYDLVVVDTAPTGHTLRMFAMPEVVRGLARIFDDMQEKHRMVAEALRGSWTPDAADALIAELDNDGRDIAALLRDPARVRMTWVTLPEPMSLEETRDAIRTLRTEGIPLSEVVVNRLTPDPPQPCRWCSARRRFERSTVAALRRVSTRLVLTAVSARNQEPRGAAALLDIGRELDVQIRWNIRTDSRRATSVTAHSPAGRRSASLPVDEPTRLLLFGGKGGAGKTTCAAAAALEIAARYPERHVLLISTDPAHSLADALGQKLSDAPRGLGGGPKNLLARELDAAGRFAAVRDRYAEAIDALFDRFSRGSLVDASHDRRVMRDLIDLAPPGIDEVAAVIEVTDALAVDRSRGGFDLIVMDTAPSGHALRLLEMPEIAQGWVKALMAILLKYQPVLGAGDIGRLLLSLSQGLGRLRDLLADPSRARFVAVTRAEQMSVLETLRLLKRLDTLHVSVPLVVANAVGAGTCDNCTGRRAAEQRALVALGRSLRPRKSAVLALAPAVMPPPSGSTALKRWRGTWTER